MPLMRPKKINVAEGGEEAAAEEAVADNNNNNPETTLTRKTRRASGPHPDILMGLPEMRVLIIIRTDALLFIVQILLPVAGLPSHPILDQNQ